GDAHALIAPTWIRAGVDIRYVTVVEKGEPAVSVGLIDGQGQPRFVHTPGVNRSLIADDLQPAELAEQGARFLHIAGFFALPGLLDGRLPQVLAGAKSLGMTLSLDVINSPRLDTPELLWSCLPHLDYFFCNLREGQRLTCQEETASVAAEIRRRGAGVTIVKLGEKGCWLASEAWQGLVPTEAREAVDTTGAGDAFAAGFIAAVLDGADDRTACVQGHRSAARIVSCRGAVAGWFNPDT
ncbi:MAG: carbohydrate kinase family protein, partial [Syntrophaceae bacterium]|nr:carbohydrate kinase family protein [Syntrophaceae bacterium]